MKKILIVLALISFAAIFANAVPKPGKTYRNEKYGFRMDFPASWKGLKVIEKSTDWTPGVKAPTLYFCLPTKVKGYPGEAPGYASPFAITVFTKAQLNVIRAYAKKHGELPGEEISISKNNGVHYFSPGGAQDLPDDLHERMSDVQDILKTFKFLK